VTAKPPPPRKAGRPKSPPTEVLRIRLPLPLHAKLIERGGDVWVKRIIAQAIEQPQNIGGYQPIPSSSTMEPKPPPKKP
jgi:hypothetical protein